MLIADMFHAALTAFSQAPNGQLKKSQLLQAIASKVKLDDWATQVYDNGAVRWQSIFAFASIGLKRAGYVEKQGGIWTITEEGRQVINSPYDGQAFLLSVRQRYRQWKLTQLAPTTETSSDPATPSLDLAFETDTEPTEEPHEGISRILKSAHEDLAAELLNEIKQCDPTFFERLVVKLMLSMGYGGTQRDAGRLVAQPGDHGVDGVINEDPLGLDKIYLQAKRWDDPVGEGPVRDFIGALDIAGVKKGVLLTTSSFTAPAKQAVDGIRSDKKIVLIDGAHLAQLMIEHNLGVSEADTFVLKRIDSDFFSES